MGTGAGGLAELQSNLRPPENLCWTEVELRVRVLKYTQDFRLGKSFLGNGNSRQRQWLEAVMAALVWDGCILIRVCFVFCCEGFLATPLESMCELPLLYRN